MNNSKLAFLLILIPLAFFITNATVFQNPQPPTRSLDYYQPDFDELGKDDLAMSSTQGTLVQYFRVEGITPRNEIIIRKGYKPREVQELLEGDIYKLNNRFKFRDIIDKQLIHSDKYFSETLEVLTRDDFYKILDKYYTETYKWKDFNVTVPDTVFSKIIYSPFRDSYLLLFYIVLLLIFKSLNRYINSFLPNWAHDWIFVIPAILLARFFLMGSFIVFLQVVSETQVLWNIIPLLIPLVLYLTYRYSKETLKTKSFAVRQLFYLILIIMGGGFLKLLSILFASWYFQDNDRMNPIIYYGELTLWDQILHVTYAFFMIAISNLVVNLIFRYFKMRKQNKQLSETQTNLMLSEEKLQAVQSRVNPHFLYNSLNSIAALSTIEPKKTEKMALALSSFYRYATNREDQVFHSISEEINLIKSYIEVEQIRFGDKLIFDMNISERAKNLAIPRFLIQPLIENAIKYGFDSDSNCYHIQLNIETAADDILIVVGDKGQGFPDDLNSGYGINSIRNKLRLLYQDKASISFQNAPQKQVLIKINTHGQG